MAPSRRGPKTSSSTLSGQSLGAPPEPFKQPAEVLKPFVQSLSKKHIYLTHVDGHPAAFKRKLFIVPVALNVAIVAAFFFRLWWIWPWYWKVVQSLCGVRTELSIDTAGVPFESLVWEMAKRGFTFFIDFCLFVFVWPWPVEFVAGNLRGKKHGSPILWRWAVGFRDKEIYVRRSRDWDKVLGDVFRDRDSIKIFVGCVKDATSPLLQEQKTGYLLMNGQWDLDWQLMVRATTMVDKKDIALEGFRNVVLIHHKDYGWLQYDLKGAATAEEDSKRRQVFMFRDALTALGKDDLFFRWVEMVQFEATKPGGFGPERQEEAAKKIRDLFSSNGVDFDAVWKEAVGEEGTGLM